MGNTNLNWGYKTTPQPQLHNRVLGYDRGKGIGGSTAINFATWSCPARDEIDVLARLTEDDDWSWHSFDRHRRNLECYHSVDGSRETAKYHNPRMEDHGQHGPIQVSVQAPWGKQLLPLLDICEEGGYRLNPDQLCGDPIGVGIKGEAVYKGYRSTATDLLTAYPDNLTIRTTHHVAKILFNEKTAIGVKTADGHQFLATKEVLLSAGVIDSPKVLMLSGIGDQEELSKHGIDIVHHLPSIGKHLLDHPIIHLIWDRKEGSSKVEPVSTDPQDQQTFLEQWHKDRTGPLSTSSHCQAVGFLKTTTIFDSQEFQNLPENTRSLLTKPTVPSFELIMNLPNLFNRSKSTKDYMVFVLGLQNTQSSGTITLASSDPTTPPLIDAGLLTHEFDQRLATESTKQVLKLAQLPTFARNTLGVDLGPRSEADEDILDFWRETVMGFWHPVGTVKMGSQGIDDQACVDNNLCVYGVDRLRVVDASILPIIPSCHTMIAAYAIGMTAGGKIPRKYRLDRSHE